MPGSTLLPTTLASVGVALRTALSDPRILGAWVVLVVAALAVLWWDLRRTSDGIGSLMRFVWTLTVVYSGPLGLAVYWYAGRTGIPHDSLWRRGCRSTAHCYSGCGAGEIVGITLAQGILALATASVAAVTFGFAYLFGFGLTVGPLVQDGEALGTAVVDALYSETPSITVMEVTAIGADLLLAREATMGDPLSLGRARVLAVARLHRGIPRQRRTRPGRRQGGDGEPGGQLTR